MSFTETLTWRPVEAAKPEHDQLCLVIRASDSEPRVLRFNDDEETGTYWYDPTLPVVRSIDAYDGDFWAPVPMAPIAPLPELAVAS